MKSEVLLKKLSFPRAYKEVRLEIAHWVIENSETFPQLLDICFNTKLPISHKAAWILELVCMGNLALLFPHLDVFFKNLSKVDKDQAVRPLSKICLMLAKQFYKKRNLPIINSLKLEHRQSMTDCCFDWLISNQKVATEAYSMDTLYYLGTEIGWIHPELKGIIEQNTPLKSAAYKARGRMTLEKIEKFRLKLRNS